MEDKKYTKDDIERLRQIRDTDPGKLKPEEIKYANLHPIEKGEVRNPKGRTKGAKNWSTYFKNLLNDEKFLSTIIKNIPSSWNDTVEKYPASVIAAGLIATATQSVAKAVANGNPIDEQTLKTLDRIQKFAFGDKITHDVEEEGFFERINFNFEIVPDREKES